MIPYFHYTIIPLGPLTVQVWGLMVALGISAAALLVNFLVKKHSLSTTIMFDLGLWTIISGFIFARLFHVLFYNFDYFFVHPLEILQIWHGGLSSLGGFFGAALAIALDARAKHLSAQQLLPYCDIGMLGLWLGWGIGRLGCFLIHDHPGTLSHFLLSVKYPGGARHDLGLYDSIVGFSLFIIFALLFKKLFKKRPGLMATHSIILYAITRFFLDFLRATDLPGSDARYQQLTPAQWGMMAIVIALTSLLVFGKVKPSSLSK